MISHHTFCNSTKVVFVGGLGRLTSEWQKPKQTSSTQAQLAGCLPWCISWPIMPFFFHALCKWRNSASVSATPDNTILKNKKTFHIRKYEGYRWRTVANQDCNFKPEHLPVMLQHGTKLHKHSPQAWWVCEWMPTPRRRGRVTDGKGSGRNAEAKLEWTVKFPGATGDNGASFSCSFFSWIPGCHSDGFPVQRNTNQHCNNVTQTEHSLFTERIDPNTMTAEDQILRSPAFRVGAYTLLSYG